MVKKKEAKTKVIDEEETWCVTCGKLSLNGEFGTKENPYCPYCKTFWEEVEEEEIV